MNGKPPRLIFATNNQHKVDEIRAAIDSTWEIISLKEAGIDIDIPEPHDTLEANASEKSATIHRLTGLDCFSEDTGLEVAVLNGEPGVKSARYAGEDRSPDSNIKKLLQNLEGHEDRRARFRTVISLLLDKKEYLFEGICKGRILTTPAGSKGFGYDPVFAPDGQPHRSDRQPRRSDRQPHRSTADPQIPHRESRSFAEMNMQEKALYSHRKAALDKLILFLNNRNFLNTHYT
jgi:XTP/dITP diphosphohydrolase